MNTAYSLLYGAIGAYTPTCAQECADREMILSQMTRHDDLLIRDNALMHFTASGWIVSPGRERVLMVYHELYRSWSWTGGHADGDSDLLAVAMREAREETGLSAVRAVTPEIFSLEVLGVAGHEKRGRYVSSHLHLNLTYLLEADPSLPLRPAPGETGAVVWMDAREAVDRSTEIHMQAIYRKLTQKTRDL